MTDYPGSCSPPLGCNAACQFTVLRLVSGWKGDDSRRLSEQLNTLPNLVPVPFCGCDGRQVGEYMKNRKSYEKDIVVVGG